MRVRLRSSALAAVAALLVAASCATSENTRRSPARLVRVHEGDLESVASCMLEFLRDTRRTERCRLGELAELETGAETMVHCQWLLQPAGPGLVRIEYRRVGLVRESMLQEGIEVIERCAGPRHPDLE